MSSVDVTFAAGLLICLVLAATQYEGLCAGSPPVGYRARQGLQYEPVRPRFAEADAQRPREVLWRPDSMGPNPFGFIPTEWTVRPQLLPLTWEAQTVFATENGR
jgi:hypothetical protein